MVFLAVLAFAGAGQAAELTVDMGQAPRPVSPELYGIFYEDINHAADGGLYAELVRNRSFEDALPPEHCTIKDGKLCTPAGWSMDYKIDSPIPGWSLLRGVESDGDMALDESKRLNDAQRAALKVTAKTASGRLGVANSGYWGIALKQGAGYNFSLFACAQDGFSGPLTVSLESADGTKVHASQDISSLTGDWKKFEGELTSNATDNDARLVITTKAAGTFWLDVVSLFPKETYKNRPNGLRADLAGMLEDMKPAFVRFPGGCFVEGFCMDTTLRWKKTIGPIETRPSHWNLWGSCSTNGLGYHELLQLCEDLGAAPMFVINCGMSCQGRNPEIVPVDQLGEWIQDALDAIEYANGPADSKWGAVRAAAGHPEPFGLKYLEIGNENSGGEYNAHYKAFADVIKAKHPEIQLISNVPVEGAAVDIFDDHYYSDPAFFLGKTGQYDKHDRGKAKIYVGEYAVTKNCGKGNLRAALAEAAFMTGMERNGDHVVMCSYAPLFVHVNDRTWNPDAIQFDNYRACGTPSYYVQKLFSEYRCDETYPVTVNGPKLTSKSGGKVGLATWNTQAEYKDFKVTQGRKVLLENAFAENARHWKPESGDWSVVDGAYRQMSMDTNVRSTVGSLAWDEYTITLKARKISGSEGFMIMFNVRDKNNWGWWNIGGWQNRMHGLEICGNGASGAAGARVNGSIETGRWYDIRVDVSPTHIRCLLDGKVIHDEDLASTPLMAAVAGHKGDDLLLKVINASGEPQQTKVRLDGGAKVDKEGMAIVLADADDAVENTLDEPVKIVPREASVKVSGNTFDYEFPPYSLTILRLKTEIQ
jgi:alpha-L-arabinofuranosidase